MRTKDGLKLIIDRAQYLKASKSFKKSFSQNTLQTVLPSLRIFLGYFLLRYVWNFIFALSRTIIIFSTSNSTEKVFVMTWLCSFFPEAAEIQDLFLP